MVLLIDVTFGTGSIFPKKIRYFVHIIYKAYTGILVVSTFTLSHLKRLLFLFTLYN